MLSWPAVFRGFHCQTWLRLVWPHAVFGSFRSPLEITLVVILGYNVIYSDCSYGSLLVLASCLLQHIIFDGIRWQLSLLYMGILMHMFMRQPAAVVVIVVNIVLTIIACVLFPFIFPLPYQGPHAVGSVDIHLRPYTNLALPEDTWGLNVRIFYPTKAMSPKTNMPRCSLTVLGFITLISAVIPVRSYLQASPIPAVLLCLSALSFDMWYNTSSTHTPYLPEGLISARGFAKYAGLPFILFTHLTRFYINAQENARLLRPSSDLPACPALWPVMIFSHGLGGTRTAYTTLVTDLVSKGMVVVCPEHADGSGSVTIVGGRVIPHEEITVTRFEQEEHVIRQRQLNRRTRELLWVTQALKQIQKGDLHHFDDNICEALSSFGNALMLEGATMCGHSFGGATALHAMLEPGHGGVNIPKDMLPLPEFFGNVICLDPWMYPLSEHVLETACLSAPAMIIHAEKFQWDINRAREDKVSSRAKAGLIHLRLKQAGHHNYADFGLVAPVVSRMLKLVGDCDPVEIQMMLNRVISSFVLTCFELKALKMEPNDALLPFHHILNQKYGRFFDFLDEPTDISK